MSHTSGLLLIPPGLPQICTLGNSQPAVNVSTDTYTTIVLVNPPHLTQHTRCVTPQDRQPNFQLHHDALRNNH